MNDSCTECIKKDARISALEYALSSIKKHLEIITPTGCQYSTVWVIANRALTEVQHDS